jgi:hypothetical protein
VKTSKGIRFFLVTLGLLATLFSLGLFQSPPAMADGANTFTFVERTPFDQIVEVPCAGEYVHLTGELNDVIHVTETSTGHWHLVVVASGMGMSAVGLTSGDIYRGVGATRFSGNVDPGHIISGTDNSLLIGPGPGNNLYLRSRFHVSITPNGELTFARDIEEVTCD